MGISLEVHAPPYKPPFPPLQWIPPLSHPTNSPLRWTRAFVQESLQEYVVQDSFDPFIVEHSLLTIHTKVHLKADVLNANIEQLFDRREFMMRCWLYTDDLEWDKQYIPGYDLNTTEPLVHMPCISWCCYLYSKKTFAFQWLFMQHLYLYLHITTEQPRDLQIRQVRGAISVPKYVAVWQAAVADPYGLQSDSDLLCFLTRLAARCSQMVSCQVEKWPLIPLWLILLQTFMLRGKSILEMKQRARQFHERLRPFLGAQGYNMYDQFVRHCNSLRYG